MTESYLMPQAAPGPAMAPAAAVPPPPPFAPRRTARERSYAEWFAWARQHVEDVGAAHAAARAAIEQQDAGRDIGTAAAAAQAAATNPAPPAGAVDPGLENYAGWFAWASLELKLDRDRSHIAAEAATSAQDGGAPPAAAAEAAMEAAGLHDQPLAQPSGRSLPLWQDRAVRAVLFGIVCLVTPFAFNIYFPILPVFGLLYSFRALSSRRLPVAIVGLVLNGIAMVLNVLIFLKVL